MRIIRKNRSDEKTYTTKVAHSYKEDYKLITTIGPSRQFKNMVEICQSDSDGTIFMGPCVDKKVWNKIGKIMGWGDKK